MTAPTTARLGCTIYHHGEREQSRLLTGCVGPLARALAERGLCHELWWTRFDARAPHVLALFTGRADAMPALREQVAAAVSAYLAESPSRAELSEEERAERHRNCRGKALSPVDCYPGHPDDNTFVLHDHSAEPYPYFLTGDMPAGERVWRFASALSLWAIDCLAASPERAATGAAVPWLSAFERALAAAGHAPRGYWRYHAGTIMGDLDTRLATGRIVPSQAMSRIGARNRRVLAQLWDQPPSPGAPDPAELVEAVGVGSNEAQRLGVLREILHVLLLQLGLPTHLQIVIILFAWLRGHDPDQAPFDEAAT